jgi:hypothetical protein
MNAKPHAERDYAPIHAKTLPQVLAHFLATEFPHLGGPKVRALFVTEVMQLLETYCVAAPRLQPGQTVWYAVDKTDLPSQRRSMADTRLVPVVLTLLAPDDVARLMRGESVATVRGQRIARLHREADAQGGVLAETDTSLLLGPNPRSISRAIHAYEEAHGCIIPRRGTVHDLGPSVTHKALIAKKMLHEAKQAPDVAFETAHSLASAERYLVDLMRVHISLNRRGMSVEETAFATRLSLSLVKEYAALIQDLGLTDQQLPSLMLELATTAQGRQAAALTDCDTQGVAEASPTP